MVLHNALLLGTLDWPAILLYAAFIEGYALLSWWALSRWYSPARSPDLGVLFLFLDLVPLALTVYVTGADRSWVFWVFLFRVGDQTPTYFRRALLFTHLSVLSYLAVVAYVAAFEARPVSWPPELAKAAFLYLGALYIATTARTSERIRSQLRDAIHVARESVRELERARREAEEASEAKSQFLSRVSHELRTPMNVILGFAQLLEMDELTDEQRSQVREILEGGRHLLDVINEVMDIARVETGALARAREPVSLRAALEDVLQQAGPAAAARQVALPSRLPASCDVDVLASGRKLRQVIGHLVSNAIRHGGSPGEVAIDCVVDGDVVRVSVSDRGPGIPEEALEAAFTPFVRLGTGEQADGAGLGLPLARALIQAMGGRLGVESRSGGGATFWFELSRVEGRKPEGGEDMTDTGAADGAAVVLYIDDKPENIALVRRILARRPNTELVTATLGERGLELARERRPDLVLLDVELPDVGGVEVLRRLREDPATREIPVVVVSAEAAPATVERLMEEGARAYFTMPYEISDFLETVEGLLKGSA